MKSSPIIKNFKRFIEYRDFDPRSFIKNPIALRRMTSKLRQTELANELQVTQAYISKIEQDDYVPSSSLLDKTFQTIEKLRKK